MVIWGAATFAVVPPLQMRVMRVASEAPGLSSSVNIGAFNLGNALGAAAGGAVVSAGLGYSFVPVMGRLSPDWRCCWCCSPAAPPQSRLRQRLNTQMRRACSPHLLKAEQAERIVLRGVTQQATGLFQR